MLQMLLHLNISCWRFSNDEGAIRAIKKTMCLIFSETVVFRCRVWPKELWGAGSVMRNQGHGLHTSLYRRYAMREWGRIPFHRNWLAGHLRREGHVEEEQRRLRNEGGMMAAMCPWSCCFISQVNLLRHLDHFQWLDSSLHREEQRS